MMQKRKIYVLAGLLLCSVSAFAQSGKKSVAVDRKNQTALPVRAVLPGEENLSAQERAERDFLMPTRRKKTAEKVEEAQQAAVEVTARNLEAAEATVAAEEAVEPAVKAAPRARHRTSHRRSSSHRSSTHSTKRKTTSKSGSSKSKHVTKKPASKRRR
ncbi:hypothetical protein [Hymenobacter crusticola]|uniref:Uncharacterized protein n=1 Tax=Hymenobacter crusticola TaxID=1770526 RepID=A0A243WHR1_9BACT|nr:hypothetical protein [Hymenobacter crusticola]OUJ75381.1 hypothetical protein BXP70_05035 [Hymenobacter crusticola]